MSTPLVNFFTKIGFDIDTKSLGELNSQLSLLEQRFGRMASKMNASMAKLPISRGVTPAERTAQRVKEVASVKVDNNASSNLNGLGKAIDVVNAKAENLNKTLSKLSDSKALNITSRLLNAEARKLNAEARVASVQAATAKVQAGVEKLKQATLKEEAKVLNTRTKTAQIEASTRYTEARTALKSTLPARHDISTRTSPSRGGVGGSGMFGRIGDISVGQAATAIATSNVATDLFRTANFTQSRMPQYTFLTGSAEKAREQIAFVDSEVKRLSLNLIGANHQYKQLLASGATSIGVEKTQELFTNFNNLSTMLGLGEDAQKRATNAFSQMLAKGQIMAEELKGQ